MLIDVNCSTCAHTWEDLVKSVSSLPCCPECGSAFTKAILFTNGPTIMGHAKQRITNRALRGGSGPTIRSVVPRSYRIKPKTGYLGVKGGKTY